MRLATAANEAYTASLAVSELLGCKQCGGSRGQDEVPGQGTGRVGGRAPGQLLGLHGGRVASPPSHPNSFGERSPGRAPLELPPGRPPCPAGRRRLARAPQVKGRPVGGGAFATASRPRAENAAAGRDSCLGHLNGSLRNVNNVVFCTSLHKPEET